METIFQQLVNWLLLLVVLLLALSLVALIAYALLLWYRWKDREARSLKLVTLLVVIPQDNEIKIDAMEQIINSMASMYKSAKFKFLQIFQTQLAASLEIIGTKEDIRFYVSVPTEYQDLIEKQIYSVYAGADIQVVEEPNIFTEDGAVEYSWLALKKTPYLPLKTYKEISTDPLAAITSALSKLNEKRNCGDSNSDFTD